jgi:murein DD-endopeptidase MepM/ murein hydrolase activator NlpD
MSKRPRDFSSLERPPLEPRPRGKNQREQRPRPETLAPKSVPPAAETSPAPAVHKAHPPSRLPMIVFGLIALIGLGATVAALMIHVLTGGRQTEFSEEVLAQELVPVEPATSPESPGQSAGEPDTAGDPLAEDETIDLSTPTLIALRGDPIIVQRRQSVARQLAKIEADKSKKNAALKTDGEIFKLTDNLGTAPVSLVSGSQLGFAFSSNDAEVEADDADPDTADAGPAPQPGADDDATLLTVVSSDESAAGPSRVIIAKPVAAETSVGDFLSSSGFDADLSRLVETQSTPLLGKPKLDTAYSVAAVGLRQEGDDTSGYTPVQVAFYKDGQFQSALAINEAGAYVPAANPWFGQDPFHGPDEGVGGTKQRLLDAVYGAAVRNNLPTTVAGEIIMLLSRQHDLEQPANGNETMQVLYVSKARDRKTGLGKVLYVRIDRGEGEALECFAFQPQQRKPFECISSGGEGAAATGGMTVPVKGVLDRKFGPGRDPVTKKRRMFYGVEWIAPPGTPVVAAYSGSVISAGSDPQLGNVVKLSHEGGQVTVYGHLKTIASNMAEGRSVRAGQRLGTVGVTDGGTDSRLYFELRRNDQPVDPFGAYQAKVEKGGAIEALVYRITTVESGNNCKAKNPLSSAAGLGQFINSTWLRIIRDYRPDLVAGRSQGEILDLRYDCAISLEMTTALTRENANYIRARGHTVTPGNLYLAHFLGPGGAAQALGSSPDTPIITAFGAGVVKANPFLTGQNCGYLIEWAARKMAGKGKAPVIAPSGGGGTAQAQSLASNKDFLQYRDSVMALLN